jgi:hypothetical protein
MCPLCGGEDSLTHVFAICPALLARRNHILRLVRSTLLTLVGPSLRAWAPVFRRALAECPHEMWSLSHSGPLRTRLAEPLKRLSKKNAKQVCSKFLAMSKTLFEGARALWIERSQMLKALTGTSPGVPLDYCPTPSAPCPIVAATPLPPGRGMRSDTNGSAATQPRFPVPSALITSFMAPVRPDRLDPPLPPAISGGDRGLPLPTLVTSAPPEPEEPALDAPPDHEPPTSAPSSLVARPLPPSTRRRRRRTPASHSIVEYFAPGFRPRPPSRDPVDIVHNVDRVVSAAGGPPRVGVG